MSDADFQLPRSSYDELVKIVRAYSSAGSEASLESVSQYAAMNRTVVSRNNKFLITSGILEGGQRKSLTNIGNELAQALDYEMPENIQSAWRKVVENNDFFGKVLSALRIRKGMELGALRTHIAYTAGEKKTSSVMTGATVIIDILRASGLVRDEDGTIVSLVHNQEENTQELTTEQVLPTSTIEPLQSIKVFTTKIGQGNLPITLAIEVHIDCKPSDLESLGPKLNALFDGLTPSTDSNEE